nr:DUF2793 domain-containing protein [Croceibacterium sp. D39]
MLHPACEGEAVSPPASPADGDAWLVGSGATSEWTGEDGKLASWQAGAWLFTAPNDGMQLFDRSTGQILLYAGDWQRPVAPLAPNGGTNVDSEARAAISDLIAALVAGGILAAS